MPQQVENNKNNILKALQVVTTENFTPDRKPRKCSHEELNVTTQDKVQLKMLKILQNIEEKLSDRPTPRISNQTPEKTKKKWC